MKGDYFDRAGRHRFFGPVATRQRIFETDDTDTLLAMIRARTADEWLFW